MACFGQGFSTLGEHPPFHVAELEQEFMVGRMGFPWFFLTGLQELLGRLCVGWLTIQGGVSDGACSANCAQDIQFIRIKEDFCFQCFRFIFSAPETVRPDAVLNGLDLFLRPVFFRQHFSGKLGGYDVVSCSFAVVFPGRAAAGVVEECRCPDDLQVCIFYFCEPLCDPEDSQDMLKVVYRVSILVPFRSFFDGDLDH